MNDDAGADPTRPVRTVTVDAPVEEAFRVFVERFDQVRPREPLDDGRTRLRLEHRHLDRNGPGWEGVASGVGDHQGRPLYLGRYAALLPDAP